MNDEKFKKIYNDIMSTSKEEVESAKKDVDGAKTLWYIIFWGLFISMFLLLFIGIVYNDGEYISEFALFIILLPIFSIIGLVIFSKSVRDSLNTFSTLFIEKVVMPILDTHNINAKLNKEKKFTKEDYALSNLEMGNSFVSTPLIEGHFKKQNFQFSLVKTESIYYINNVVHHYILFNGLVLKLDLGKNLPNISIRKKPKLFKKHLIKKKNEIEIDISEFNEKYYLYSDNKEYAKKVLNKENINKILELNDKYNSIFDFTIKDNNLFIRIHCGDIFSPKDLSENEIYKSYNAICFMFEVLEYLLKEFTVYE